MSNYEKLVGIFNEYKHLLYIKQVLLEDEKLHLPAGAKSHRAQAMVSFEKLLFRVLNPFEELITLAKTEVLTDEVQSKLAFLEEQYKDIVATASFATKFPAAQIAHDSTDAAYEELSNIYTEYFHLKYLRAILHWYNYAGIAPDSAQKRADGIGAFSKYISQQMKATRISELLHVMADRIGPRDFSLVPNPPSKTRRAVFPQRASQSRFTPIA